MATKNVFAHPIDQTSIELYIQEDWNGTELEPGQIRGVHTLNWVQAAGLVSDDGSSDVLPESFDPYVDTLLAYIQQNLSIENNSDQCDIHNIAIPEQKRENITVVGLFITFRVSCPSEIDDLRIENTFLIKEYATQKNYVSIYAKPAELIDARNLDTKNTVWDVDINPDVDVSGIGTGNDSTTNEEQREVNFDDSLPQKTEGIQGADKLLGRLSGFLEGQGSWGMIVVLLITFLIGLLHTLEAGHSKVILASMMIDERMDIKQGFWYVVVFTLTHMADIVVIGVVLLLLNTVVDIASQLSQIQLFANYILLGMGLFMFFRALSDILKHRMQHAQGYEHDHHHNHDHDHSHEIRGQTLKEQLTVAFITGLAPCLMGWSVFLLILAAGQTLLLLPAVISFGLGIFAGLLAVMLVTVRLKDAIQSKVNWIGEYSPLISAGILIVVAVLLIV